MNIQTSVRSYLAQEENITMVVGISDSENTPHTSLVYFSSDDNLNLYFLTLSTTRKFLSLQTSSKIAFTIGFGNTLTSVYGNGVAEAFTSGSPEESRTILSIRERLSKKANIWPVLKLTGSKIEDIVVFKIIPSSIKLLNLEKDHSSLPYNEAIQTVL
jgi:general stress protein 26